MRVFILLCQQNRRQPWSLSSAIQWVPGDPVDTMGTKQGRCTFRESLIFQKDLWKGSPENTENADTSSCLILRHDLYSEFPVQGWGHITQAFDPHPEHITTPTNFRWLRIHTGNKSRIQDSMLFLEDLLTYQQPLGYEAVPGETHLQWLKAGGVQRLCIYVFLRP